MSLKFPRYYFNWNRLPGEYPNGDIIQACLFIIFLVVWVADLILKGTTWLNNYIPIAFRLILGFFFIFLSYFLMKQSDSDLFFHPCPFKEPVQTGLYRYCRHPMYLGVIFFHLGLGIISISLISWIFILITIKFYNYLAKYEEGRLLKAYSNKYKDYMMLVPRWIPKKIRQNHLINVDHLILISNMRALFSNVFQIKYSKQY
ncbi:MAG: methyltransferase family protein [Promethearchaeota archaeon]